MKLITTTTRGLFVTYCRYIVIIATVSYQYCYFGPAHSKRGNLGPVPAPVAQGCRNNVYFVGIYLFSLHQHTSPIYTTIQRHSLFITTHTKNTERRSTIRGRMIVVREIFTQIEITWIQLILGNILLCPISVRSCPGPECGVFCILIVDLILRSALVGFILLRASDYYNRKGPVFYVLTLYSHYR